MTQTATQQVELVPSRTLARRPDSTSAPARTTAAGLLALLRPKQWVKNGFVVAPLLFSREFLHPAALWGTALAVAYFCITASATYVLNDIKDQQKDRAHPVKRLKRPIAAGRVTPRAAWVTLGVLYAIAATSAITMPLVAAVLLAYALINVAYSLHLKHRPVVDIFTIASGFVLRVIAGSFAIHAAVSSWMCITVLCLALYLAAIKRRQEFRANGSSSRAALESYTAPLIDRYAEMSATGALVFYSMFVLTIQTHLAFTVPLVIFGLFRYWYVIERHGRGESPTETLLRDWQLMGLIVVWAVSSAIALWPGH